MVRLTSLLLLFCLPASAIWAESGLPVPRFVSMKAKEANIRKGPGTNFPIKWVLVKKYLPVEITDEHQDWRKIKDIQGDEGWVHRAMLAGKRTVMVQHPEIVLRNTQKAESRRLARLERGVIAIAKECNGESCKLSLQGLEGWVQQEGLFGLYPGEVF